MPDPLENPDFQTCWSYKVYTVNGIDELAHCQKEKGHTHYHEYVGTVMITWIGDV